MTDEDGYSAFHLRLADGRTVEAKFFGEARTSALIVGLSGERILPGRTAIGGRW